MKMLIRAYQFLEHAKKHAQSKSDFDIMIAIHNLDNSIEYMLRIIIKHLEIEEKTGKSITSPELSYIIGEIQKFLKDNNAPNLSYVEEMKMIRNLRNMVQHAMINPYGDVQTYLNFGEKFFDKSLSKYFGVSKAELRFSTLIMDIVIKEKMKMAEVKIDEGKFLESIVQSRDAFDYAKFIYASQFGERLWNAPALSEIKDSYNNLYMMLENMNENINLNSMNINMSQYNHYMEYVRCIPSEYCADWSGNTVLQREWNKDDAEFCYLFVANALLDWQIHDMGPIQEISADINEFRFSEKICGVETRKHFVEKGCKYGLENQTADLFYIASKEELEELKKGIEKGVACCEFKRWCFEQLQAYHTYLIKINNSDYRFIMNNPPTWEMIVFYDNIPFTNKDMCGNGIDIDGELDGSFDEAIKEILQQYIPLETVEKANELLETLNKINFNDVDRLYSSKLIEILTVNE